MLAYINFVKQLSYALKYKEVTVDEKENERAVLNVFFFDLRNALWLWVLWETSTFSFHWTM